MNLRPFLLPLALLPLACRSYSAAPLPAAALQAQLAARDLRDPQLAKLIETRLGHPAPELWDADSLALAAQHFGRLDQARAQLALARGEAVSAGELPNPTISATPTHISSSPAHPWSWALSLDLPIDVVGKRSTAESAASHRLHAAERELVAAVWSLRCDLRKDLDGLATTSQKLALLRDETAAREQLRISLSARHAAGDIDAAPLRFAEQSWLEASTRLRQTQSQLVDQRAALALRIGLSPQALAKVKLAGSSGKIADDGAFDPESSNVVAAARCRYDAAEEDLRLEVLKQYPDLHLLPGFTREDGQNKGSLGIALELPIFSRNGGAIAQAEARRQAAAAVLIRTHDEVLSQVAAARRHLAEESRQCRLSEELLKSSLKRDAARLEIEKKSGALDRPEIIAARLAMIALNQQLLEARARRLSAAAELESLLETPQIPAEAQP